jgi:putative DNA primase/helicase
MDSIEFQKRVKEAKDRAHGRWTELFRVCGVDAAVLNRKNQPCPHCGGTDRFQYTDKDGEGGYFCRGCGPGDAFKLIQFATGLSFIETLKRIEECVGTSPAPVPAPTPAPHGPTPDRMRQLARRIWHEAKPIVRGDAVDAYLRNRGIALETYPGALRCHPALGYYQSKEGAKKATKVAEYPAMLACVQGADGHGITLHRTYLHKGKKAALPDAKKLLSAGINGAAVRLSEATEEVAVTEGIETGLAVLLSTAKPVWSAINAGNLEKLWLPAGVKRVLIYADNDAESQFDGQASAYALARRLTKESKKTVEREVSVFVPKHSGHDWADVWLARAANQPKAA